MHLVKAHRSLVPHADVLKALSWVPFPQIKVGKECPYSEAIRQLHWRLT